MENGGEKINKTRIPHKINLLIKEIQIINNLMQELNVPEKVIEKQIKNFGNASHVILPKEYANKTAKVIIQNHKNNVLPRAKGRNL